MTSHQEPAGWVLPSSCWVAWGWGQGHSAVLISCSQTVRLGAPENHVIHAKAGIRWTDNWSLLSRGRRRRFSSPGVGRTPMDTPLAMTQLSVARARHAPT